MEIILPANNGILQILKRFRKNVPGGRRMKYTLEVPVDEGILLFNVLTRELVRLDQAEYENLTELPELKNRWFVVPEDTNEKELADLVKWVLQARQKQTGNITHYTIFTTTDCNARCFYCYELGRSRIPMGEETARKVVRYIKAHCGGEKVHLAWFGGEPLFNLTAIDTICDGLRREGVEFVSTMISNGYLFDGATVKKAVDNWNLKHVQISLDGTEQVYNRSKAYIYREGSPYQVVLANMERLLDASVRIAVRLNMDLYNADDLMKLVAELEQRFKERDGLHVYTHILFEKNNPMAELHSEEEWQKRDDAMERLWSKIQRCGLASRRGIAKSLKMNHCMADSGHSVTILPTGDIGLCEHFSENEFIGHVDREGFHQETVNSWKEKTPEIPECADCFCYPACVELRKCPNAGICFPQRRQDKLRQTRRQMMNEYRNWQISAETEETEDSGFC